MQNVQEPVKASIASAPMESLANHHETLTALYKDATPEEMTTDSDTAALVQFNGYYSTGTSGQFLTVDTNMHVNETGSTLHISIILSLNGTSSASYDFTKSDNGTFQNNQLKLTTPDGVVFDLTFTQGGKNGITASFTGTVVTSTGTHTLNGTTYNNAIDYSMYEGVYYEDLILKVMNIGANSSLMYDYNSNDGQLKTVPSYTYNLNMYFFSFNDSTDTYSYRIIMGTSASGGLVCNDMQVEKTTKKVKSTRSLQTVILSDKVATTNPNNANSKELAELAGFYRIKSTNGSSKVSANAFVSVEGKYTCTSATSKKNYTVEIGVSLDGTTSKVYTFDSTMNFDLTTGLLTIGSELSLTFKPGYVKTGNFGSLVSVSGTVSGNSVVGQTPLAPVPLMGFGGATLTNAKNETLTLNSSQEITFNGTPVTDLVYVPVMYILASETLVNNETIVLSLGTDGEQGIACIITVIPHLKSEIKGINKPQISCVTAIPKKS